MEHVVYQEWAHTRDGATSRYICSQCGQSIAYDQDYDLVEEWWMSPCPGPDSQIPYEFVGCETDKLAKDTWQPVVWTDEDRQSFTDWLNGPNPCIDLDFKEGG